MDELIEWFSQFLQEVQEVADQLSEEEAEEISQFIQSVIQFIDTNQSNSKDRLLLLSTLIYQRVNTYLQMLKDLLMIQKKGK